MPTAMVITFPLAMNSLNSLINAFIPKTPFPYLVSISLIVTDYGAFCKGDGWQKNRPFWGRF